MTAGSSARVYVSHLSGIGVFDPAGDTLGKVRDLVVVLRHDREPPRVLGLVMEVQRRRIFLPMTRVTTIDAGQVVVNARLDLRRFQQRPGETLVIGELLDRRVTIGTDDQPATIVDAAIEQDRNRDWRITRLHVTRVLRGFRRRGEATTLPWSEVRGLSVGGAPEEQGVDSLLAIIDTLRPADLANVLQDLPGKRRLEVARNLEDERLADVLEELPEDDRVQILTDLGLERAADILELMEPDDAADLLSEVTPEQAAEFLEEMEPDEAEDLRRLLSYGELTAGGMMNPEPIMLLPDATVAEALARVRSPEVSPSLAAQVYVVRAPLDTPSGKFLGVAHFQRLLREPPSKLVSAVIDTSLEPVGPLAPLSTVTRYFATYNLVALPVVDELDRLLGAVTVDDVIDHMLPEDWRDLDSEPDDSDEED
ncbi:MAG TPA: CBS domain-containing protein [Candidatus Limnocylindrales bacterium]|nr:CBS domain-containing protein [Candidatus Limnocylindrales bacterium]